MLSRRKRTEYLIERRRQSALDAAALIESEAEIEIVVDAHQGLVMNQVRESARNSRFYLGEALMTECRVRVNGCEGLGAVLGADIKLARALAVIDGAYACGENLRCLTEVDALIAQEGRVAAAHRVKEENRTLASRVSFNEMGGQDMSVQAVVK